MRTSSRFTKCNMRRAIALAAVFGCLLPAGAAFSANFPCGCRIWPLHQDEESGEWVYYSEKYESTSAEPPGFGCDSSIDVVYLTNPDPDQYPEYCDNGGADPCDCDTNCVGGICAPVPVRDISTSAALPRPFTGGADAHNAGKILDFLIKKHGIAQKPEARHATHVVQKRLLNLVGFSSTHRLIKVLAVQLLINPEEVGIHRPARLIWVGIEIADEPNPATIPMRILSKINPTAKLKPGEFQLIEIPNTTTKGTFRARVRDESAGKSSAPFQILIFTTDKRT